MARNSQGQFTSEPVNPFETPKGTGTGNQVNLDMKLNQDTDTFEHDRVTVKGDSRVKKPQ